MHRPTTRRAFLAAAATLAGCTGSTDGDTGTSTPSDNPALGDADQQGDLTLASPAFDDGGPIPDRYSRDGANVNPPLTVANVPSDAASLTLVVDDPDAVEPAGEVWLHWLVWNVPPTTTEIPEGWDPTAATVGRNDFGNRRYDGPDPPDGEHSYRFKLYALDATLDLAASASKREVGAAMRGHVLSQTQLTGTYAP